MISLLLSGQVEHPDIEVHLVALNRGGLCDRAEALGVPYRVVNEAGKGFYPLLRDVREALGSIGPAIVHSHRYKENLISYLSSSPRSFRCVVSLHGYEPAAPGWKRLRQELRLRAIHALGAWAGVRYATVSEDLRRTLRISPDRCTLIPNAVETEGHAGRSSQEPGTAPIVGWVGRMVPIKNLDLLLRALHGLPPELGHARLLLVGDGPSRQMVQEEIERLGLVGRVECTGHVEDPKLEMDRMNVFALPSSHEGLPMALLEAMARGLPCVASAVGGIPEAVGDSGAVQLIKSRDASSWTAALADILGHPDRAAALGRAGRELVIERFSLPRAVEAYWRLYQRAAGG